MMLRQGSFWKQRLRDVLSVDSEQPISMDMAVTILRQEEGAVIATLIGVMHVHSLSNREIQVAMFMVKRFARVTTLSDISCKHRTPMMSVAGAQFVMFAALADLASSAMGIVWFVKALFHQARCKCR